MSELEKEIREMINNGEDGNNAFFICKDKCEREEKCLVPEYDLDDIWRSLKKDGLVK